MRLPSLAPTVGFRKMGCLALASFTYCGRAAEKCLKKGVPSLEMEVVPMRLEPSRGNTHALFSTAFQWYCPGHSERLRSAGFPRPAAAVVHSGGDEPLLQCQPRSAQGVQGTCQVGHGAGGASIPSRRGEAVRALPFLEFQSDRQGQNRACHRGPTTAERRPRMCPAGTRDLLDVRCEQRAGGAEGAGGTGKMFVPLSLLSASSVRLDVRAAADLVPLRDPGLSQWPGLVGAGNGSRGAEVSPQRQQVSLGGRLAACAGVVASAVGNVVAHGAG